jgi:hypothetical protein
MLLWGFLGSPIKNQSEKAWIVQALAGLPSNGFYGRLTGDQETQMIGKLL